MLNFYIGILLVIVYLFVMLLIVLWKKDNYVGNFTWGIGVGIIALYTFFLKDFHLARHTLITTLTLFWTIRLGIYFYSRYHKGINPKYLEWQRKWGKSALFISFAWIFFGQGILMIIMSLPIIVTNLSNLQGINWLDILATVIWSIGFFFESVGDYQLYNFMKKPENKGKIMKSGLWHYSRHPNYFGEIVMWWGIFLIALSIPLGLYTIIAPLTITILLVFFTGIPVNEAPMKNNFEYQQYKKSTNILIPGKPKKIKAN